MRDNFGFTGLIVGAIIVILIIFSFKLFGFLLMILVKYWFIWVPLIVAGIIAGAIARAIAAKKVEKTRRGEYIETEYRVEKEDNDRTRT